MKSREEVRRRKTICYDLLSLRIPFCPVKIAASLRTSQ